MDVLSTLAASRHLTCKPRQSCSERACPARRRIMRIVFTWHTSARASPLTTGASQPANRALRLSINTPSARLIFCSRFHSR